MTATATRRSTSKTTFTDFEIGVQMAKAGSPESDCANGMQLSGWNWYGEDCYLRAMEAAGEPADSCIEDDYTWIRTGC